MRGLCWLLVIFAHSSVDSCNPEKCRCDVHTTGELEFSCPVDNDYRVMVNAQPGKAVHVQCTEKATTGDFGLLDDGLDIGPTPSVLLRQCPLPTTSFATFFNNTRISSLIYASYRNLSHQLMPLHLKDLNSLTQLRLPHNGLTILPSDLLLETTNITSLDLIDNFISVIPKNFFLSVPKLTTLELGNNLIEQIENNLFENLSKLKLLNIWNNKLKYLKGGEFNNLSNLNSLDIHSNQLETLPVNIFKDLVNVEVLNLMRNQFITLPDGLLKNNKRLKILTLLDNGKNLTLPSKFLADLEFLEEIYLINNGIFELPKDIFEGSEFIKNISLNKNVLTELPLEIFASQTNLIMLDLSYNKFSYLPDNIFRNLQNLKILNLGFNMITKITKDLLRGLQNLEYLNVENNMLSTIDSSAFNDLTSLREAHFSRNNLTWFNFEMYDTFGSRSPFHSCLKLEKLYLANNSLLEIFQDWKILILTLKVLDLSYNNIQNLQSNDLLFLSRNIVVNLRFNKISRIQVGQLWADENEPSTRGVPRLYLADNPLVCNCLAYDLWQYTNHQMPSPVYGLVRLELDGLKCAEPNPLANRSFLDVKSEELVCSLTADCPEPCECAFRPVDNAVLVNCSARALTKVPERFPNLFRSHHIELILEDNMLTQLPNASLPTFENVTHLYLSRNHITQLEPAILSDKLKVLTADNNNLTHVSLSVINKLSENSSLRLITLHDNPWSCDCDNRDFLAWLQRRYKLVSFLGNVTCSNGDVLNNLSAGDLCPAPLALVLFCSTVAAAGIIIGMLAALYYRYQQNIHVWMYAHHFCLWWVTEAELDRDKRYDVFVSFSQKDADFVVKQIVPKLEESGLKLCLHYRDWIAGEWIPNQIARSVEDSRRTLVVLSPNFLESVWGAMEFRTAHKQALSEGRARVVMLLYGDLPPTEELHVELKAYISLNTYVKWGDPWFWNKLRYALPHSPLPSTKKVKVNDRLELMSANLIPTSVPTTPPVLSSPNLTNMLQTPSDFSSAALC